MVRDLCMQRQILRLNKLPRLKRNHKLTNISEHACCFCQSNWAPIDINYMPALNDGTPTEKGVLKGNDPVSIVYPLSVFILDEFETCYKLLITPFSTFCDSSFAIE